MGGRLPFVFPFSFEQNYARGRKEFKNFNDQRELYHLLHFVAFFHVASLFSTGVDNEKVEVDGENALEMTNSTVFHR